MPASTPAASAAHLAYSFDEFTLDLDRGALLRAGADVKLRPKSYEVLSYLIERQGLLITKDELLNAIWGRTVVTDDAITQCLSDIRRAIHDQSQEKIRTIPRRGYIFDLPVTKNGGPATATDAPSTTRFASNWPRWRFAAALVLMLGVAVVWLGFGYLWVTGPVTVESAPRVITTANTEAHDAYLRGRYLAVQHTRASIDGAIREFEKAIAVDPDYALAHAEIAMATIMLGVVSDITTTERINRATPHAERAMALEPTLAEAHAATGVVLWEQGNLEEAMTHFEQAIQINPEYSIVYLWMANLLGNRLGRYKEAVVMWKKAARLDPLSITIITTFTHLLINSNRLAEADRELEKLKSIAPPGWYTSIRGTRMSVGGKWSNTVLANLDVLRIVRDRDSVPARNILTEFFAAIGLDREALAISAAPRPGVLRNLGRPEDAVTTAETRLAEDPNSPWDRRDLGLALAAAGDYARARPILEEMWQRSRGRITIYGIFNTESAAALIAIRRDAGEETGSGGLVAVLKDNAHRYREAGMIRARLFYAADYDDGLASFLAGNRKKGLALIARAAEDGYFIRPGEAYLQSLYDDPDFAPIRASQEARQAREREKFLARVCTVNPYETVWQPAEGTCERFAVAVGN